MDTDYQTYQLFKEALDLDAETKIEASEATDGAEFSPHGQWPILSEEALHGVAGEIVQLIEPHTESDSVALLVQFLTAFGCCIGPTAHCRVEQTPHFLKLFTVLVGETAKGRKGTAWNHVLSLIQAVDPDFVTNRIQSGLSSGQGLIWAVRDPIGNDPGVTDKRLLAMEPELASVLKVAEQKESTLSATIRQGWDSINLRILNKNSPARATGTHIGIIGHITKTELLRRLESTEAANGFANRFLWVCVRRSKCLPDGGDIQNVDFGPATRRLVAAKEFSLTVGEMRRDERAREIWHAVYPSLSDGKPGLLGNIISRAEAQTIRLSCLYALLDESPVVRAEHLQAALALWQYCEDSARYIFGAATGDPLADKILDALSSKPEGMTRNKIREHFHRNKSAKQTQPALDQLLRMHLAYPVKEESGEPGRSTERWFCGDGTRKTR